MNCIYGDKGECPVRRLGMHVCKRRFMDDCRSCEKVGGDEVEREGMSEGLQGKWKTSLGTCNEP